MPSNYIAVRNRLCTAIEIHPYFILPARPRADEYLLIGWIKYNTNKDSNVLFM